MQGLARAGPVPWYSSDPAGEYASSHEVTFLALAYVNYGISVVGGEATVRDLMEKVLAAAPEYVVDQPWKVPDAWRKHDQHLVTEAKSILEQGTSVAGHGKHLQVIEEVMARAFGLFLDHRNIEHYRKRLVASKSSTKPKPLFVPNLENPRFPYLRFPHMLPAVARMVIRDWSALQQRLDQAVEHIDLAVLTGGSPTKAACKAQVLELTGEVVMLMGRLEETEETMELERTKHKRLEMKRKRLETKRKDNRLRNSKTAQHKARKSRADAVEQAVAKIRPELMAKYDAAVAECNAKSEALVHADAELERLEKAASTAEGISALYFEQLRDAKGKIKELAGELRFAENRIFELEEELERDLQAKAEMAYDKTDEGYDEATGVESGRTYTPEFRAQVLKLLALRVPVASVVPVLQATGQLPVEEKPPSLWWILNMRRELSVVVLILAASKAADPKVRWVQVVTDATTTDGFQTVCMCLMRLRVTSAARRASSRRRRQKA